MQVHREFCCRQCVSHAPTKVSIPERVDIRLCWLTTAFSSDFEDLFHFKRRELRIGFEHQSDDACDGWCGIGCA